MEHKIRHLTCERCRNRHIITILRGDREKHTFTCPQCSNTSDVQGFLEVIDQARARVILSQSFNLHLAVWIIFGLAALCCLICCSILHFRPESYTEQGSWAAILSLALNGSWYIIVIGFLLLISALINQGLSSYKLITIAAAIVALSLLYFQSRYFIAPEDLTLWFVYIISLIVIGLCIRPPIIRGGGA